MNVVITGGNRGIGLALTKQYKARGAKVYATCRNSCDELNSAGVTIIKGVDVSQPEMLAEKLAPLMDVLTSICSLIMPECSDARVLTIGIQIPSIINLGLMH